MVHTSLSIGISDAIKEYAMYCHAIRRYATNIASVSILSTGNLNAKQRDIFYRNALFVGMKLPEVKSVEPFEKRMPPKCSNDVINAMKVRL